MGCVEVDRAETCNAHLGNFAMGSSPKAVCGSSHGLGSGRLIILKILLELKKDTVVATANAFKSPFKISNLGGFCFA